MQTLGLSIADMMMIASVAALFVAVFLLVRTLYPQEAIEEVRERAAAARAQAAGAGQVVGAAPAPEPPGYLRTLGLAFVQKLGNYSSGLASDSFRQRMKRRFTAMGRPELRPEDFIAHQMIWAVCFGLLGLMLLDMLRRPLWAAVFFAGFGALFPYIWLRDQVLKRQRAITRALPYHIDLLTLSVEAGLDFQAALATVVEKGRPGALIEELSLLMSEMRLGKTRAEALRNLADRTQIPDVTAFVANLIQADRMGTSLGKVLRIQTTQMRVNRTHRAEKAANEAPVKMLLPLIGCIFPTVFIVLFGPIVYRLMFGG